jgi:LmbE family N-acetylglucosaminyl deacetylase
MSAAPQRRRVLVVSPHFDDVPLSLGQSLTDGALRGCRVQVRVAFGRTNWTRWMHPTPGRAPVVGIWRRAEETVAAVRFGYRWRTGGWAESLLRTGDLDPASFLDPNRDLSGDPLVDELARWLGGLLAPVRGPRPELLLVPAGLGGHVDHRLVALAGAAVDGSASTPVGFYEDRPYAAYLDDEQLRAQLAPVGEGAEAVWISGPIAESTQRRVRRSYPSQIDEYFEQAMQRDRQAGARERVWFARARRPDWFGDPASS